MKLDRRLPIFGFSALLIGSLACTTAATRSVPDAPANAPINAPAKPGAPLTGEAAMGDWTTDAPGVRRKITAKDLPAPYATRSVDNGPNMIGRPDGAWPRVPDGFKVTEFATDLNNPRVVVTAPNGDIFVAESRPGRVRVLRDADNDGKPEVNQVFVENLRQPFGIAFYPLGNNPKYVYIANTDSVVRFPYQNGDLQPGGAREMVIEDVPGGGRLRGGGHWTRDIQFSNDGKTLFLSIGSLTNVNQEGNPIEEHRARIVAYDPDGKNGRVYASGIRNPVGLAVQPSTGALWTSVNERDGLGDHLVPDYITSVKPSGFYGWPWYYIGANQDPRHDGAHPELKDKVIVPDVLLQSHMASLDLAFYTGKQFPKSYQGDLFAAEHGSWNRSRRTGYKVIRVPFAGKKNSEGVYEDFMTGFVTADGNVWGRPVGVAVAKDGAMIISDDGGNLLWRVAYTGK